MLPFLFVCTFFYVAVVLLLATVVVAIVFVAINVVAVNSHSLSLSSANMNFINKTTKHKIIMHPHIHTTINCQHLCDLYSIWHYSKTNIRLVTTVQHRQNTPIQYSCDTINTENDIFFPCVALSATNVPHIFDGIRKHNEEPSKSI